MRQELGTKLRWFYNNLSLQVADLDAETRGDDIQTYLDTSDVRDSVLGMYAFYSPGGGFRDTTRVFNGRRTLVHCLAGSGWLGKVRMLPPHRSEFLTLLHLHFGIRIETDIKVDVKNFLYSVGLTDSVARDLLPSAGQEQDDTEFVRRHAGSAATLYKAIQCVRGSWRSRLERMYSHGYLDIDRTPFSYDQVFSSPAFVTLKQAFDRKRELTILNNVADAAAVTMLVSKTREYDRQRSTMAPRFLAPTGLFCDVVRNADIPNTEGFLRDDDYFIFKATFRPPPEVLSSSRVGFHAPIDLRALKDKVGTILDANRPLTPEIVDQIDVAGRPLGDLLDDVHNLSFLENVWLPFLAKRDMTQARVEIEETAREVVGNSSFRKSAKGAIRAALENLTADAIQYRRISSFWLDLDEAARQLSRRVGHVGDDDIDVFRAFGLLRFGFPASTRNTIKVIFRQLLSRDEDRQRIALNDVVGAFHASAVLDPLTDEKATHQLSVVMAVGWVLNLDPHLRAAVSAKKTVPHFSLSAVLAASMFRRGFDLTKGRTVLTELRKLERRMTDSVERANLRVAISYLYFHLLRSSGYVPRWRRVDVSEGLDDHEGRRIGESAIEYARRACVLLSTSRRIKETAPLEVYALNQHLYYLVECGTDDTIDEMKELAKKVAGYKAQRDLWSYRYDDTLARYFHRLATTEPIRERRNLLMNSARQHIDQARQHSYGDEDVESYQSVLATAMVD